ncbi:hypothetical protein ElyMa_006292800 [Elysia marginata]|uniref:Uncharacterized protein n=1 Tax=Elysia marginata TaxID=1093978 RepID=A0AAV4HGK1_9GAST|nr:hypothetical protein ElyMa_006292800 [Elysia marginata]
MRFVFLVGYLSAYAAGILGMSMGSGLATELSTGESSGDWGLLSGGRLACAASGTLVGSGHVDMLVVIMPAGEANVAGGNLGITGMYIIYRQRNFRLRKCHPA